MPAAPTPTAATAAIAGMATQVGADHMIFSPPQGLGAYSLQVRCTLAAAARNSFTAAAAQGHSVTSMRWVCPVAGDGNTSCTPNAQLQGLPSLYAAAGPGMLACNQVRLIGASLLMLLTSSRQRRVRCRSEIRTAKHSPIQDALSQVSMVLSGPFRLLGP